MVTLRLSLTTLAVSIALILSAIFGGQWLQARAFSSNAILTQVIAVDRVKEIVRIAALEIDVSDVLTGAQSRDLHNPLTGQKLGELSKTEIIVIARGDVTMAVDVEKCHVAVLDATHQITISLPPPAPTRPRVDMERSTVYRLDRSGPLSLLISSGSSEAQIMTDGMAAVQRSIEGAGNQPKYRVLAKQRISSMIKGVAAILGWSVQITWQDEVEPQAVRG